MVEVYLAAVLADAVVELVVLIAGHALVKAADAVKQLLLPAAERHRIDIPILLREAVGRIAHAKRGLEHLGNRLAHEAPAARFEHAARIVAVLGEERFHRQADIVLRIFRMGVKAHNHIRLAGADADVHGIGHRAVGVVEHDNLRMLLLHFMEHRHRAVLRPAVDKDDLHQIGRVILRENGRHTGGDIFFLVAHGKDDGNERQLHESNSQHQSCISTCKQKE